MVMQGPRSPDRANSDHWPTRFAKDRLMDTQQDDPQEHVETAELDDAELNTISGGDPNEARVSQDGQGSGYTRLRK